MTGPHEMAKWTTLTFRIFSEELSLEEISRALGLEPTAARAKGELLSPRNPRSMRAKANLWMLESGVAPTEALTSHLSAMLDVVEAKSATLQELSRQCKFDFFVGFSSENQQAGDVVKHAVLTRLAKWPIDLVLDLYPPSEAGRP
jgi:hypothetical protein